MDKGGRCWNQTFHTSVTLRHKNNLIPQLQKDNGETVYNHIDKVAILWEAFKERLGHSEFNNITFNLDTLLDRNPNLAWLEEPFTGDEIDSVVRSLPNNKAPGPDGFNNEFPKKCWHFIKEDFYALCSAFQDSSVCLQSINDSLVTLIPKIDGAQKVGDFRPISLLNYSIKLITKLLAK
jgi:hypothetical protein